MNLVNSTPERATSLSRSASRASGRSRTSSLSKSQSLIKKNIELQDLKPADVLIERFVAWKAIVKQLTAYFEGIADIENNTARELTKLAGVIQVPFRAGNQFLGEGGLQDIYYDIRNKTRIIADQHADLGRTIDSSIVQHLQKLRIEIKAHVKNVQNDTGKLAAGVARERELSTKLVGELANAISTFKNTPMVLQPRNDPFVANQAVSRQLSRQVVEENLLHKSIVMMQQNSAHFEEGIVKSIQSAWQTFDEWQARASAATQNVYRGLAEHMATLAPDREWIQFAARSDHLLHPDTPLRDPEFIKYPLKDDPSVVPVHTGHLERKKRFTRSYVESYFVLTPAGFLHEYATSDSGSGKQSLIPTFSLFLPNCTLGPASSPRSTAHKFHIEGRKDGLGTTKSGSFKGMLGGDANKAWNFRARSHDDMMEWWNDIRMLCARYLVASEQVDRTGPVEDAVRSVGYDSEAFEEEFSDEEEEEELEVLEVHGAPEDRAIGAGEAPPPVRMSSTGAARVGITGDDGSSVEEELDNEHPYEEPPVYSHPTGEKYAAGVEIGPHGYALEKKSIPGGYPPPINSASRGEDGIAFHNQPVNAKYHAAPNLVHNHSYAEVRSQRAIVDGEQGPITPHEEDQPHVDTGEQKLGRRLNQRQMEKSPEHDVAGVGHVPTQRHVNLGQGLPPAIQLRDPGVVAGAPHPKKQDSASRHRSPPPRVYLSDEEDEAGEMAQKVEGAQEEDEDMYVKNDSEPRLRASDDHYLEQRSLSPSPVPVAGANTSISAASENGNAVKSSYPAPIMRNGHATTATSKSPTPSHRVESEQSSVPEVDVVGPAAGVVGSEEGEIPIKNKKLKKQRGKKGMVDSISEAVGIKASENGEA